MKIAPQRRAGFTLVEMMIVLLIIFLIMGWGVPAFVRSFQKDPLAQSVADVLEACHTARARAILTTQPAQMVISAEGGISVQGGAVGGGNGGSGQFSAQLAEGVGVELIGVNFQDMREAAEARVSFYPNGTCDEFTVVLAAPGTPQRRQITLDVVTGLAVVKNEDQIGR